jgi:hypothetical protein
MAYVQVEADDVRTPVLLQSLILNLFDQRLEEGPEGLQFKCMIFAAAGKVANSPVHNFSIPGCRQRWGEWKCTGSNEITRLGDRGSRLVGS